MIKTFEEDLKKSIENIEIGPEEKKFNEWLEKEKEKGLTNFRVSYAIKDISCKSDGTLSINYEKTSKNREEFFKELNSMNDAVATGKCVPWIDEYNESVSYITDL